MAPGGRVALLTTSVLVPKKNGLCILAAPTGFTLQLGGEHIHPTVFAHII